MCDTPFCRFCFESTPPLITPCKCTGTQSHIHAHCLHRWQHELSSHRGRKNPMACPVCLDVYNTPLPWSCRGIGLWSTCVALWGKCPDPVFVWGVMFLALSSLALPATIFACVAMIVSPESRPSCIFGIIFSAPAIYARYGKGLRLACRRTRSGFFTIDIIQVESRWIRDDGDDPRWRV